MNTETELQKPSAPQHFKHGIVLFLIALLGFYIIGPIVGTLLAIVFTDISLNDLQSILLTPMSHPQGRAFILTTQVGATLGMLLLPLLVATTRYDIPKSFYSPKALLPTLSILAIIITSTFTGFNAIIIDWNMNIDLPEFMNGFEQWARQTEEAMSELTEYLTTFTNPLRLVVMIFVIAVFPAIAEEYVFRGVLQNKLAHGIGNIHIAIWVSAFFFSAIHMQFLGFFPRMFLGALFGYLYYWSGNIVVPIITHFFNNGFVLIMIYLFNTGYIDFNIQESESPSLATASIFAIITVGLLYFFRKLSLKQPDEKLANDILD